MPGKSVAPKVKTATLHYQYCNRDYIVRPWLLTEIATSYMLKWTLVNPLCLPEKLISEHIHKKSRPSIRNQSRLNPGPYRRPARHLKYFGLTISYRGRCACYWAKNNDDNTTANEYLERNTYHSMFQPRGPCDWWTPDTGTLTTSSVEVAHSSVTTQSTAAPPVGERTQHRRELVHSCLTHLAVQNTAMSMPRAALPGRLQHTLYTTRDEYCKMLIFRDFNSKFILMPFTFAISNLKIQLLRSLVQSALCGLGLGPL